MLDDMNTQGNRSSSSDKSQPQRAGAERQPLTDREVPLEQSRTPASLHAWLDGEVAESAVRTAETARDVDFWRKVTEETERRRAVHAPVDLEARIMAALPIDNVAADAEATGWQKEVTMTKGTAAAAAASLLAAGAAATVAVLRALR